MLFFTVLMLAAFATSNALVNKVPLVDGTFQLLTDVEINLILDLEAIAPTYDAYNDVDFHLYTRSNPTDSYLVEIDNVASLEASHFNSAHPTVFLVHGWIWNYELFFVQQAKDEYLAKGDYNVIAVDWSKGGSTENYVLARYRVHSTGVVVGKFIEFLESNGLSIDDVIVAGYSLGGHVVANAGKYLDGRLPVMFGLDPAGPLFLPIDLDRLIPSDAGYVEVIHTHTQLNGYLAPCGDADFYPNGGMSQPGCGQNATCSHDRAPYYFIESINGNVQFIGKKCVTFATMTPGGCLFQLGATKVMGGEPHTPGNGVYHVTVNSVSPFATG